MQTFLNITKALSDETRVKALLSLRGGELCLCELVDLLDVAPSTASRHMTLLWQAGLVQRRKDGRWHYFRLVGEDAPATVRDALAWVFRTIDADRVAPLPRRRRSTITCDLIALTRPATKARA
ncbi:MAG: metalloregulator ArsR/SmtB family transcription factor [Phycisphaeraceae bacterium]